MSDFAFCETRFAGPLAKWHIRRLTGKGLKPGGGADTAALCGRAVDWDLGVELSEFHLGRNTCEKCRHMFKQADKAGGE